MRLAVVVLLTLAAAGCTRRQADFAWIAVAVAAEVASHANGQTESSGPGVAAPDPDQHRGPSAADLQRAHDVAWELTRIAAHDARTDNCDAVVRTSKHVRVIDPAVFANAFLRDREIQRCLALAPEPALTSGVTVIQ